MHLISALISGVRGAENGTAEIRKRGAAAFATIYGDFEGGTVLADNPVTLDADGGAEVYVNELAEITVKDTSGNIKRQWVAGVDAPAVEVKSLAFSGTDYESAEVAAGKPTTAQAIIDLWKTTNGATDWKVFVDGSEQSIKDLAENWAGLFYNVKSPVYGAKGNGTDDDTSAIQAAMDAAETAGGGLVVFPEGTYRVTSSLTPGDGVSLLGANTDAVTITIDHASADLINFDTDTSFQWQTVTGIRFVASQTHTGAIVKVTTGKKAKILLQACIFGDGTNAQGLIFTNGSSSDMRFVDCGFFAAGSGSAVDSSAGVARFNRCTFTVPPSGGYTPTNGGLVYGNLVYLVQCFFDNFGATTGTWSNIKFSSTSVIGVVTRCDFSGALGTGTIIGIDMGTYTSFSSFVEADNVFSTDSQFTAYDYEVTAGSEGGDVKLRTRDERIQRISSNVASVSVSPDQYGVVVIERTGTTNFVFGPDTVPQKRYPPDGAKTTYIIHNRGSGTIANISPTSNEFGGGDSITNLLDTNIATYDTVMFLDSGSSYAKMIALGDFKVMVP